MPSSTKTSQTSTSTAWREHLLKILEIPDTLYTSTFAFRPCFSIRRREAMGLWLRSSQLRNDCEAADYFYVFCRCLCTTVLCSDSPEREPHACNLPA